MLNEIARVFSSNGVLIPGSDYAPVQGRKAKATSACDHKGPDCTCFEPKFDQAAAKLELSQQGKDKAEAGAKADDAPGKPEAGAATKKGADGKPLSDDEQKAVQELTKRDREVKAHEAAHQASAGGHAKGGASFDYQTGPDGRQYAVGGHVDIDVSPVKGNPEATLQKAQTVQRAALAPADPSGQDRAVAAAAAQMALQAQREAAEEKAGAGKSENGGEGSGNDASDRRDPGAEATSAADSARIRGYGRNRQNAGEALNVVG